MTIPGWVLFLMLVLTIAIPYGLLALWLNRRLRVWTAQRLRRLFGITDEYPED
jgi:hypothetical protein